MNVLRSQRNNDDEKKNYVTHRVDNDDVVSLQLHCQHCFLARRWCPYREQTNEIRPVDWCIVCGSFTNINCIYTWTLHVYSIHIEDTIVAYVWDFIYTSLWATSTRALWDVDRHKGNISAQYTRPNCIRRFQSSAICVFMQCSFIPLFTFNDTYSDFDTHRWSPGTMN